MRQNGEPIVVINGILLTHAQSAVMRLAIEHFNANLGQLPDPMDEGVSLGPAMQEVFKDRVKEIQAIIYVL